MPLRLAQGTPISIETPHVSAHLSAAALDLAVLPEEGLPEPPRGRLDIRPVRQLNESWCWAACVRMVLRFFEGTLEQCQIAGRELGASCCGALLPAECGEGCTIDQVDEAFELSGLAGTRIDAVLEFDELMTEISGERPVVAGIAWSRGGGHVVVICGCRVVGGARFVRINDPFYGPGDIRYDDLRDRYGPNNTGKWEHTWFNFSLA